MTVQTKGKQKKRVHIVERGDREAEFEHEVRGNEQAEFSALRTESTTTSQHGRRLLRHLLPPLPPPNDPMPYTKDEEKTILKNIVQRGRIMFVQKRTIHYLKTMIDPNFYYIVVGSKPYTAEKFFAMLETTEMDPYLPFNVMFRLCGGKGGFGSLLKSFRVNKSTNQLMCRDLNGRRLASMDEEKKLRKWLERAQDREKERIEKKKARYEKLKAGKPKHDFNDTEYIRVREEILERTEDACEEAFQRVRDQKEKAELEKLLKGNGKSAEKSDTDSDAEDVEGDGGDPVESMFHGRGKMRTKKGKAQEEKNKDERKRKRNDSDSSSEDSEDDVDPELIAQLKEYIDNKENAEDTPCSSKSKISSSSNESKKESPKKSGGKETEKKTKGIETESKEKQKEQEEEVLEPLNMANFSAIEQIEKLGAAQLKFELQNRGLKCGGTVRERAERLFSVKDLSPEDYPDKLLADGGKQKKK